MSGIERELRAHQLGSALRGLAAELVEERRKVADLRREVAELRQRLEALQKAQRSEDAEAGGGGALATLDRRAESRTRRARLSRDAARRTGL